MKKIVPAINSVFLDIRLLFYILISPLAVVLAYTLANVLPGELSQPGSPLMQSLAIVGTILLIITFYGVLSKRFGLPSRFGTVIHIISGSLGTILVTLHSAGNIYSTPGSLIFLLFMVIFLGGWLRVVMPENFSMTFGTKLRGFAPLDEGKKQKLKEIISSKEILLSEVEPSAHEGLFSLTFRHWIRSPLLAYNYRKLEKLEEEIMGKRASVEPAQAYCRQLHQALSWLLLIGVAVHVITVTFFANYVADGRSIYWWHIKDWG